jgi:sec-independent protein translocase protein TatA
MRPEPWHLIVLLLVFLVLFGGKKLPEAARGLGRSLRIFKAEVKEMHDEDAARAATRETGPLEGRVMRPGEAPVHNGRCTTRRRFETPRCRTFRRCAGPSRCARQTSAQRDCDVGASLRPTLALLPTADGPHRTPPSSA